MNGLKIDRRWRAVKFLLNRGIITAILLCGLNTNAIVTNVLRQLEAGNSGIVIQTNATTYKLFGFGGSGSFTNLMTNSVTLSLQTASESYNFTTNQPPNSTPNGVDFIVTNVPLSFIAPSNGLYTLKFFASQSISNNPWSSVLGDSGPRAYLWYRQSDTNYYQVKELYSLIYGAATSDFGSVNVFRSTNGYSAFAEGLITFRMLSGDSLTVSNSHLNSIADPIDAYMNNEAYYEILSTVLSSTMAGGAGGSSSVTNFTFATNSYETATSSSVDITTNIPGRVFTPRVSSGVSNQWKIDATNAAITQIAKSNNYNGTYVGIGLFTNLNQAALHWLQATGTTSINPVYLNVSGAIMMGYNASLEQFYFLTAPIFDGRNVTNIDGFYIRDDTINSNKFDPPTRALLGSISTGGVSFSLPIVSTNNQIWWTNTANGVGLLYSETAGELRLNSVLRSTAYYGVGSGLTFDNEVYGPGWDSDVTGPTKNAVYDILNPLAVAATTNYAYVITNDARNVDLRGKFSGDAGDLNIYDDGGLTKNTTNLFVSIDVRQFLTPGTGGDATATRIGIQKALDYTTNVNDYTWAALNSTQAHCEVFIPEGTYYIDGPLFIRSQGTRIRGGGYWGRTTIVQQAATNIFMFKPGVVWNAGGQHRLFGMEMQDLQLSTQISGANQRYAGIFFENNEAGVNGEQSASRNMFRRVFVTGFFYGVYLNHAVNNRFEQCEFQINNFGAYLRGVDSTVFENCFFSKGYDGSQWAYTNNTACLYITTGGGSNYGVKGGFNVNIIGCELGDAKKVIYCDDLSTSVTINGMNVEMDNTDFGNYTLSSALTNSTTTNIFLTSSVSTVAHQNGYIRFRNTNNVSFMINFTSYTNNVITIPSNNFSSAFVSNGTTATILYGPNYGPAFDIQQIASLSVHGLRFGSMNDYPSAVGIFKFGPLMGRRAELQLGSQFAIEGQFLWTNGFPKVYVAAAGDVPTFDGTYPSVLVTNTGDNSVWYAPYATNQVIVTASGASSVTASNYGPYTYFNVNSTGGGTGIQTNGGTGVNNVLSNLTTMGLYITNPVNPAITIRVPAGTAGPLNILEVTNAIGERRFWLDNNGDAGGNGGGFTNLNLANVSGTSSGTNILFVSPTGNDATGARNKIGSPFKTLNVAMTNTQPGDTVLIWPGSYDVTNTVYGSNNVSIFGFSPKNTIFRYWATNAIFYIPGSDSYASGIQITNVRKDFGAVFCAGTTTGVQSFTNATMRNCWFYGDTDNINLVSSNYPTLTLEDCRFVSKYDAFNCSGAFGSTVRLKLINPQSDVIGPSVASPGAAARGLYSAGGTVIDVYGGYINGSSNSIVIDNDGVVNLHGTELKGGATSVAGTATLSFNSNIYTGKFIGDLILATNFDLKNSFGVASNNNERIVKTNIIRLANSDVIALRNSTYLTYSDANNTDGGIWFRNTSLQYPRTSWLFDSTGNYHIHYTTRPPDGKTNIVVRQYFSATNESYIPVRMRIYTSGTNAPTSYGADQFPRLVNPGGGTNSLWEVVIGTNLPPSCAYDLWHFDLGREVNSPSPSNTVWWEGAILEFY